MLRGTGSSQTHPMRMRAMKLCSGSTCVMPAKEGVYTEVYTHWLRRAFRLFTAGSYGPL